MLGGSIHVWGDAGVDDQHEALTDINHRVSVVADADADELQISVRRPGDGPKTDAEQTIDLAECDPDVGLSATQLSRIKAALGHAEFAPNIDLVIRFRTEMMTPASDLLVGPSR
jgi:esterase/lipase superfamily enzyme